MKRQKDLEASTVKYCYDADLDLEYEIEHIGKVYICRLPSGHCGIHTREIIAIQQAYNSWFDERLSALKKSIVGYTVTQGLKLRACK